MGIVADYLLPCTKEGGAVRKSIQLFFETFALFALALAFIGAFILVYNVVNPSENESSQSEILLSRRIHFAQIMMFDNNSDYSTNSLEYLTTSSESLNEIVFVKTWHEGLGEDFPSNAIVAWPTPMSEGILMYLNSRALRRNIDWDYYGLAYPITIDDVILRWEQVYKIWIRENACGNSAREIAKYYFAEEHSEYQVEIAEARQERGIPEPRLWRPPWEE